MCIRDRAKTISTKTTFSAKELAAAYFYLASAGMDAQQSMKALGEVARFAQAGAFDLSTATDLLTDAQTALGLSSKDAAVNQKNLVRVSDVLVKANTLANASVQQFAEALTSKAAASLVNVNKEMEEGVAVLAAYADKGIKGTLAGERLTMMLNGLFAATQKNKKAWDAAGISLFDAQGNMRHLGDIIGDLEVYLGNMTTEQKQATLAQLGFNVRTKDSILALMGSSEKIKQWTKNLKKAGGITQEVSDKQLKSFSAQLAIAKNKIVNAGEALGKILAPIVIKLADKISKLAEWFSNLSDTWKTVILVIGGLVAALGPVLFIVGKLLVIIPAIGAAFTVLSGPIGIAVAAIAGLIAVGVLVVAKWKEVKAFLKKIWESIANFFTSIWKGIDEATGGYLTRLVETAKIFAKAIISVFKFIGEKIFGVFKVAWDGIKNAFKAVRDWIIDRLKQLADTISKIPIIKKFVKGFKESMDELQKKYNETITVWKEGNAEYGKAIYKSIKNTKLFSKAVEIGGKFLRSFGKSAEDTKPPTDNLNKSIKTTVELAETAAQNIGILTSSMKDFQLVTVDTQRVLDNLKPVMTQVWEEALPPARDFGRVLDQVPTKFEDVKAASEEMGERVKSIWEDVSQRMKDLWTDNLGDMLLGAKSFKDALGAVWNGIKKMFADMVAKMVVTWVFDGVSSLVEGAKKAAGGISSSFKSVGKAVSGIGEGIGKLIVSLAKGIAKAAEIIAASAPAILIAAGVALAIYAGFKLIGSLFKGGSKPGSEKDFLRKITEATTSVRDMLRGDYKVEFHIIQNSLRESQKHLFAIQARADRRNELLTNMEGYLQKIRDYTEPLSKIKFAASGISETVSSPTMYMAGERGTERVNISPVGQSGSATNNLQAIFNINAIDPSTMRDVVRNQIGPEFIEFVKGGLGKTGLKEALL